MPDPLDDFDAKFDELRRMVQRDLVNGDPEMVPIAEVKAEDAIAENQNPLDELADSMDAHRVEVERLVVKSRLEAFRWTEIAIGFLRYLIAFLNSNSNDGSAPNAVAVAYAELGTRAVSVAHETLTLLRAGFGTGALARWRTLYESAVIAEVLELGNRGTAVRYRNHGYVRLHQTFNQLGPLSVEEHKFAEEAKRQSSKFKKRYGTNFGGGYGWAAELTNRKLKENNPKFKHLEQLADLSRLHQLYLSSHHDVHVDAMGTARLRNSEGILHSGPNFTELERTARATVDCLMSVSEAMVGAWQSYDSKSRPQYLALKALAAEIRATGSWATVSRLGS